MKLDRILFAAIFIALFACMVRAQEPQLVDETVARVNSDIITRSMLLKAQESLRRELEERFKGDKQKIEAEYNKLVGTILDTLIEDRLISQRATELSLDVDGDVNREILAIASQTCGKCTLSEFEELLKKQGIEIEDVRKNFKADAQRRAVLYREVVGPIYEKLKPEEKKEWYDKHIDQYRLPGAFTISEIFIPFEGHTQAEAEALAKEAISLARGGKPFPELVKSYSDPNRASTKTNGKLPTFKDSELADYLRKVVDNMKPGDVSDPIRIEKGYQIVRLDEHTPAGLVDFAKVESEIAQQIAFEKGQAELPEYYKKLRENSYIRIADTYKQQTESAKAK